MNKTYQKINKKLENHDSILRAITSYNCYNVLTLEKGYFFYWVKLYKAGYKEKSYFFDSQHDKAILAFDSILKTLNAKGLNLKFNRYGI